MKAYIRVIKNGWKELSIYKFDVFMSGILSITRILMVYLMWRVIFSTKAEVKGFTLNMMITYYIIVMLLQTLDKSQGIANVLSMEIRDGKYSKYIVKPINPFMYYLCRVLAKTSYYCIFGVISIVFWISSFQNYFLLPSNLSNLFYALLIFGLGFIFMIGFNYLIMILTFWFSNTSSFFMLKGKIVEFMTGAIIPLMLLPENIISFFKILPFYYVYYFPVTVYLGKDTNDITFAIIVLISWNIVLYGTLGLLYNKAIKSFSGVGV